MPGAFTNWHVPLWRNPAAADRDFKPPFDLTQPDYVKRVIGCRGNVDVHDGAVWINGRKLVENTRWGEQKLRRGFS